MGSRKVDGGEREWILKKESAGVYDDDALIFFCFYLYTKLALYSVHFGYIANVVSVYTT